MQEGLLEKGIEMGMAYAPKVLLAILTLVVGFWIIKRIVSFSTKAILHSGMNLTLTNFVSSLIGMGLKVMLLLSVAGMFGVNTTSFIAILVH